MTGTTGTTIGLAWITRMKRMTGISWMSRMSGITTSLMKEPEKHLTL